MNTKHYLLSGVLFFLFFNYPYTVEATSEIKFDGVNSIMAEAPISIIQEQSVNITSIVEKNAVSNSTINQTGLYNRAAIFQFGNDKHTAVEQYGLYNRLIAVQVAETEADKQEQYIRQAGGHVNYSFSQQVLATNSINSNSNLINDQLSLLTLSEADTVGRNFIFAPELSRVSVNILDDTLSHFSSITQDHLDKNRFGSCDDYKIKCDDTRSLFSVISYENNKRNDAIGTLGYKQDILSATIGADIINNTSVQAGVAFDITKSKAKIDKIVGNLDAISYQIAGFTSIIQSHFYADFIAVLGVSNFTGDRFSNQASSDFKGWGGLSKLQTGYFFGKDNFHIGPLLSLSYLNNQVHGYTENGNILLTQEIEKQHYKKLLASLGIAMNRVDTIDTFEVSSYLKFEIVRNFGIGDQDTISSYFSFSPESKVITPLSHSIEDIYHYISGGVSVMFNNKSQISLLGTALVGSDEITQRGIYAQLLIPF